MGWLNRLFHGHSGEGDAPRPRIADEARYPEVLDPTAIDATLVVQMFRDAYTDASVQGDEVKIQDVYRAYINFDENHRYLRFRVLIKCQDGVKPEAQSKYANSVNGEYIVIRATPIDNLVAFDYYLVIEGGATKRNIVLSFKRFMACTQAAIGDDKLGVF
jgi:hypothetical protein